MLQQSLLARNALIEKLEELKQQLESVIEVEQPEERRPSGKAKNLLNSHMDKLHEISKFLYEHETITGEEFMEILNRPQIVEQD